MARDLFILGVNHRSAPVALRERLAIPEGGLASALAELKTVPGIQEGAIISTCNRVEVVACVGGEPSVVSGDVEAFLARARDVEPAAFAPHSAPGATRPRHLFRVAAAWTQW
jgi:glutamyl-tRNA reductase